MYKKEAPIQDNRKLLAAPLLDRPSSTYVRRPAVERARAGALAQGSPPPNKIRRRVGLSHSARDAWTS